MKLSIIIPVYNEERTIAEILKRVVSSTLPEGVDREIIVIDDGSSDQTGKFLKRFKHPNLKVIKHKKNQGKGAAIKSGFEKSLGDIILIQDADLEYDPKDYPKLLTPIISQKVKVVYGNRFASYPLKFWGSKRTILPTHWLGNKLLSSVVNLLYHSKLRDMETGYKVFKKEVIEGIKFNSNRFEIEPEITSKILKRGYKILEIPISVNPRTHSEGKKIGWRDGFLALWSLIKYKFVE